MAERRGCTQCGSCVNTCPVYAHTRREEATPKAKQELLALLARKDGTDTRPVPVLGEGEDIGVRALLRLANRCVCCERCLAVCPRGLSVPEVLNEARARHPVWQQMAWKRWIGAGDLLWPVARAAAPLFPASLLPARLSIMRAQAGAMAEQAPVEPWIELARDAPDVLAGRDVTLFGGCTATRLRPSWMAKARRALGRLGGHVVDGRGFGCCGGTFEHGGLPDAAAKAAAGNVAAWRALGRPLMAVFCASCLHALTGYARREGLFTDEGEAARWQAALTPLSTLLAKAPLRATGKAPAVPLYHSPCHWGKKDPDFVWLRAVLPGITKGRALCCGFGGIVQLMDPAMSRAIAQNCWDGLAAARDSAVAQDTADKAGAPLMAVTGCSGCALQLRASAPQGARALHWLDTLNV